MMLRTTLGSGLLICASVAVGATALAAQEGGAPATLRVYLECSACDFDFVRTEIPYVDWVRDRADSELHIMSSLETTGGGGRRYTLDYLGLGRHAGKADTLVYVAGRDDTADTIRRGLSRVLKMGLVRYLVGSSAESRVQVAVSALPATGATQATTAQTRDPWNAWVFTVGGSGFTQGESNSNSTTLSANVGANRVTADWKLNLTGRSSYSSQSFTYAIRGGTADTTTVSISRSYTGTGLIVRSLGPHTSIGANFTVGTSTFGNTKFSVDLQPSIEYDLFPYSQWTRESLVFRYGIGLLSQKYREETVYLLMEESRAVHSGSANYATRKAWGTVSVGINGRQFLHDTGLYNLTASGNTSVNIVRGLSVSFLGQYSMIRDQIALARRNLTPEEVLLRQRQVATSYRYLSQVSFSYRFGSSLQNVVNPRYSSSGTLIVF